MDNLDLYKSQKQAFETKLKWNIYNKNFKAISKLAFSAFTFNFNIKAQEDQEALCEFISGNDYLLPIELCNFFIERNIKYSIHYRMVPKLGIKANLIFLDHVLFLKREKLHLSVKQFFNNYKIKFDFKKIPINKKNRRVLIIQFINKKSKKILAFSMDSNIWWLPKKFQKEDSRSCLTSCGWLCFQVSKYIIKS